MINIKGIYKKYNVGKENEMEVLNNISCRIERATFTTIVGPSGSGKTTFLKCISGLEQLTQGSVKINNMPIEKFSRREVNNFRKNIIAFIFQEYNLIDDLTIQENICFDLKMTSEIELLAEKWGISRVMNLFPHQCSGGQQQKAAILRALLKRTDVIFCDEPTGALDSKSSKDVLSVLKEIQHLYETTIVMVTHNNLIEQISDVIITIQDGCIKSIHKNEKPLEVMKVKW